MLSPEALAPILSFVDAIGIDIGLGTEAEDGFLPGIRVSNGRLIVDPERLHTSGDILHEAGHIAVTPSAYRSRIDGNVDEALAAALHGIDLADPAADPALRGLAQLGGEMQAIAWSYAACIHLGLPPKVVFCPGAYGMPKDQQPVQMVQQLEMGFQPGIQWLVMTGMTDPPTIFTGGRVTAHSYPRMKRWLQD